MERLSFGSMKCSQDKDSDFTCHHHPPKNMLVLSEVVGTKEDLTGLFGNCKANGKLHEANDRH